MEITRGIGLGIGITLGVIIAAVIVGIIIMVIVALYRYSLQRDFSVELFLPYYKELLRQEKFEESSDVNKIIKKLQKKEKPKEMFQDYKVDVVSYLYWEPVRGGGERLVFRHDRRIVKKK